MPSLHGMKSIASISAVIATGAITASASVATGPTWGYRASDTSMVHTSNWNTNWAACGGAHQSPINIVTTTTSCSSEKLPLKFSGRCGQFNLSEPHEPLGVKVVGGNCAVSLNSKNFKLAQFHLHAPSEHTLNGKQLDGEIHFVHVSSNGKALLVIAVFIKIDSKSDDWLGPVLDALELVNSTHSEAIVVNLEPYSTMVRKAALPGGTYNYAGSLTTPGCDEIADWWVVQNPIKISSIDFGRLHQDLVEYHVTDKGNNARPVQPLNGRVVTRYN